MSFETNRVREDFRNWSYLHWQRFTFNLNPYNLYYNEGNPYDLPQQRPARTDLTHSYVNLFVEGTRASAYLVGHIAAVLVPFGVLALIGAIVSVVS